MPKKKAKGTRPAQTGNYRHPEASALLRPEVGAQPQFGKKKPPASYRYDSSLSPALDFDAGNPTREQGELHIKEVLEAFAASRGRIKSAISTLQAEGQSDLADELQALLQGEISAGEVAVTALKALSKPFLDWAGKAERLSFEVPTLPLFVHERLSTQAILETLKGHKSDRQFDMFDLFGERDMPLHEKLLKAYEHANGWINRLILGDSLVVMNSLLHYESMAGQVQMIYMDPPYGVKFGSNFQPFVRKRDVKHNDDEHMTREPEMVKAYRDTWELGLHSYLTYMRDRLLLSRELLAPSGSIFVQISDENLHHVREVMDEVFGAENFVALVTFKKTGGQTHDLLSGVADYVLWFAKDIERLVYRQLYQHKQVGGEGGEKYNQVELPSGERIPLRKALSEYGELLPGTKVFRKDTLTSQRPPGSFSVSYQGVGYLPSPNYWKTGIEGMNRLIAANRIVVEGRRLAYVRYYDDFPVFARNNIWDDVGGIQSRTDPKVYAVQTSTSVVQRCLLMSTDPGDLVFDPTCGSGTTAYVAEQWGRRWITCDTSRVPVALARQRLLTATFPFHKLKDPPRGPAGGFVYKRKQNRKGEEIGGIVPHVTLKSIANDEPPKEEVLVDRPEQDKSITRVSGPFCVEATIPTPVDWEGDGEVDTGVAKVAEEHAGFTDRMLEVLRRSPLLHLGGGETITLRNIRLPARTLSLSAEAVVDTGQRDDLDVVIQQADEANLNALPFSGSPVAIVFGPENGAVSEKLVYEAAREAVAKNYSHLYTIGFAIEAKARQLIDNCEPAIGIAATYVQATPDLMMGDLLKNMRSSQIFSVCGLPEVRLFKSTDKDAKGLYQVELLGLDVFDPATLETDHRGGDDVPAWLLDTNYNGMVFHVCQAFFPRTSAWNALQRALKAEFEDSVWEHLSGTVSTPFEPGDNGRVAVKVIDDRGNELMLELAVKDAGK